MDPALIAAGGIAVFAAGWLGAVAHHSLVSSKGEGSPNIGQSAATIAYELLKSRDRRADTIERLTRELDEEKALGQQWFRKYWRAVDEIDDLKAEKYNVEAENRDLHIDIAEKAKRLADAGLQSAGGCDASQS